MSNLNAFNNAVLNTTEQETIQGQYFGIGAALLVGGALVVGGAFLAGKAVRRSYHYGSYGHGHGHGYGRGYGYSYSYSVNTHRGW